MLRAGIQDPEKNSLSAVVLIWASVFSSSWMGLNTVIKRGCRGMSYGGEDLRLAKLGWLKYTEVEREFYFRIVTPKQSIFFGFLFS